MKRHVLIVSLVASSAFACRSVPENETLGVERIRAADTGTIPAAAPASASAPVAAPNETLGAERIRAADTGTIPAAAPVVARPDADMLPVLERHAELGPRPIITLSPDEARRQPTLHAAARVLAEERRLAEGGAEAQAVGTADLTLPGPAGEIAARVYTPPGTAPFPVVVYFHGGGWVVGDLDAYDASARALCSKAGAVVLSTHYRQAPEHEFPAAHEDTFAAYRWAVENTDALQGDPRNIAVAGESAGGNMAVAVCLRARENGVPMPVHQLLIYPLASTALDGRSIEEHAHAKPLDKAALNWFLDRYAPQPAQRADPRLNILAADLRGLCPATVITAEIDPLRSDGLALVEQLRSAGVPVEHRDYSGVTHEFFGLGDMVADARDAQDFAAERLRLAFAGDVGD